MNCLILIQKTFYEQLGFDETVSNEVTEDENSEMMEDPEDASYYIFTRNATAENTVREFKC